MALKFQTENKLDVSMVLDTLKAAKKRILLDLGFATLSNALERVPVFTGTLKRSGVVTVNELPDMFSTFATAKVNEAQGMYDSTNQSTEDVETVYVSFNTPYASQVHENLRTRTGEPKFLENAIIETIDIFEEKMAEVIREMI